MNDTNLNDTPNETSNEVTPPPLNREAGADKNLREIAAGQKMVIFAILLHFAAFALYYYTRNPISGLVALAGSVLAIIGVIRLAVGLAQAMGLKIFFIILMFIPLISLITLLILNSIATKRLREGGYKVGLLGASKPS